MMKVSKLLQALKDFVKNYWIEWPSLLLTVGQQNKVLLNELVMRKVDPFLSYFYQMSYLIDANCDGGITKDIQT